MATTNRGSVAQNALAGRRARKRQHPPVFNGLDHTYEDRNNDFLCPVCFDIIEEAHMTKCGHSFCCRCILKSLEQNNRCPKCNFALESKEQVYPNFLLNELILKHKQQMDEKRLRLEKMNGHHVSELQEFLTQESDTLELSDVNFMLEILAQKKQQLEADCKVAHFQLLKEFLQQVRGNKQEQLDELTKEINFIDDDSKHVEIYLKTHSETASSAFSGPGIGGSGDTTVATADQDEDPRGRKASDPGSGGPSCENSTGEINGPTEVSKKNKQHSIAKHVNCTSEQNGLADDSSDGSTNAKSNQDPCRSGCSKTVDQIGTSQDGFNGSKNSGQLVFPQNTLASRRKRMHVHFEDLQQCYFNLRNNEYDGSTKISGLGEFQESLSKFTKFSSMRTLATLSYACDIFNGSSIVSSIEFDKDSEFFAIAGVTKKIKIFDYGTVIRDAVDIHYPVNEMLCNSKISCVSWSSYHKGTMASSDYEGTVTVWDAFTGQKAHVFQEHEKRCWSVDFNRVDTRLIASGSDDARVKLWSTNAENSVASLDAKANVCCVKFSPTSRYHLAFGSADHCVHYYDLRNAKQALGVFKGHRKAVSYAKFLNGDEIVSASTDSQLKLWNINKPNCLRSFEGHTNEKNFVGLATDGDYIVCGSENNSLYVYYKGLSKQLLTMKFDSVRSVLEKDKKEEDANEFVSAVCWRQGSNVVVAANSQGTIKVLELV